MELALIRPNAFSQRHVRTVLNSAELDSGRKVVLTAILRYCGRAKEHENVASRRVHKLERKINAAKKQASAADPDEQTAIRLDLASNEAKLMDAHLAKEKAEAGFADEKKKLDSALSSLDTKQRCNMYWKAGELQLKAEKRYEDVRKTAYISGVVVSGVVLAVIPLITSKFPALKPYLEFPGFVMAALAGFATIERISKTARNNLGKAFSLDKALPIKGPEPAA